jgi:predicted RNase H-like nuclease
MATTFIGIDASWKAAKPSGVAIAQGSSEEATLAAFVYPETHAELAAVVQKFQSENTIVCLDAPLIATNPLGTCRDCERDIGREFGRFDASAHVMNQPKFEMYGLGNLVQTLENLGFSHGVEGSRIQTDGLRMFEVYPHPAHIRLFERKAIIRYKRKRHRGVELQRAGLAELRDLTMRLADRDPRLHPGPAGRAFLSADISEIKGKALKKFEDLLDAWTCVYLSMHLARWEDKGNQVFGNRNGGYIVVPRYRSELR